MRLLANPLVLRMAVVLIAAGVAFMVGLVAIRMLRQEIQGDREPIEKNGFGENLPLHTYHAVIQQLKQQKHELQALQQSERRRAQTTENLSAAVLSNLSCGVLIFNSNGLVRQANAAAKAILGVASPVGMNGRELFQDASVQGGMNSARTPLADAVNASLKTFSKFEGLEANYVTRTGEQRVLQVTVSPVYGSNADVLGAACLISDCTELSRRRLDGEPHGAIPAEMMLQLQQSLTSISQDAKIIPGASGGNELRDIASRIAGEADRWHEKISQYVSGRKTVGTASGVN